MKKLLIFIFLVGCASTGVITLEIDRTLPGGTEEAMHITLEAPTKALRESSVSLTTNGVQIGLSGQQSFAGIEAVEGQNKNYRLLFWIGGLGLMVGAGIFALPNAVFLNRVGLYTSAGGAVCIGIGILAPSISKIAIPIFITGILAVVCWLVYKTLTNRDQLFKKEKEDLTLPGLPRR